MSTVICQSCRGCGEVDITEIEDCLHCVGTGQDTNSKLWTFPCGKCNGINKQYYQKKMCTRCNGEGKLHNIVFDR